MNEQMVHIEYKGMELDVSCTHVRRGGTTVVCLHGLQTNREMFEPLRAFFTRKKYSMVGIDCIGFGKSSKPEDFSYDLADQAAIVDMVIHELKLQQFFIIGHSMGGMIGTMLLKSWPGCLGLVNMEGNFVLEDCGTSLPVSESSFEEFSQKMYPELLVSLETSAEPSAALRRKCLRLTPDYAFYKTSKSIVEWSRSGKLLPEFLESPVPKVFVYGEKNRRKKDVLPVYVPTAEIKGAGHFMLSDNPEATARTVDDYLS
jgi:pimeloyl-ACP methyl ester carboxylesterase